MDGVLVDNTPVHVEAFARFCERYGVTDWRGKLAASYGMGNDDILRRLLPPELIRERGIESLAAEKERIYREIYAPSIRPVAGLRELLERLCAAGTAIAVGSSGPIENVRFVLDRCGIAEYFGLDPTLVRLAWIIFSAMGCSGIIAYILCAAIFPREPEEF